MKRIAMPLLALCCGLGSGHCVAEEGEHGSMHHPEMRGAQARFHDLMEPFWHSPPGSERTARVCTQAKEIGSRIKSMASERGPVAVLGRMAEASKRLASACDGGRAGKVDQELGRLHEDFHELMGMR